MDSQGYDLIAEENGIIRHIQLKAAHLEAKARKQKVHIALSSKPSGCIVWVYFNKETMKLGPFLFFGSSPGRPLPSLEGFKVAKHTKADAEGVKAERSEIRDIPRGKFAKYDTVEQIYEQLFKSA